MDVDLKNFLFDLAKIVFTAPFFAFGFTEALYGILNSLGINPNTKGKRKCWFFMTCFVFNLNAMLYGSR